MGVFTYEPDVSGPASAGYRTSNTPGAVRASKPRPGHHNSRNPAPPPLPSHPGAPGGGNEYKGHTRTVLPQDIPVATGTTPPPTGSQSGPGILENHYNQRMAGTDPAYEYAMGRGMDSIDNRMSAGGSFNSGARGQQLSDYAANMGAQRMGQLDSLAGGASGEHLGRLGLMFQQGLGLAGGEAGLASAYDLGAAGNMDAANRAQQQMNLNKAGVDSQFNQGRVNTLINAYGAYNSGGSGK